MSTGLNLLKEISLGQNIIFTGEASIRAGVDRRTFKEWAKKLNIEPIGYGAGNRAVYFLKDAERVIKAILEGKKKKE